MDVKTQNLSLISQVERALSHMQTFLLANPEWLGIENDLVNLYVFSFLLSEIDPNGSLHSAGQLGIEVPIPSLATGVVGRKEKIRKDLVIWPDKYQTCYHQNEKPLHRPLAILEWKRNDVPGAFNDRAFLKAYANTFEDVVGYSINVDLRASRRLDVWRIEHAEETLVSI